MAHGSQSERSIHEMLKDTPSMNESNSAIHSGSMEPRWVGDAGNSSRHHPTSLPFKTLSAPATPMSPTSPTLNGESTLLKVGASKIDSLKNWSISTYKCTRQLMLEKLGKTTRTIDSELEAQIELLRDTQRKYLQILRLTRAFSTHFHNVVQTQYAMSEAFADLAQKSPELQKEFTFNSETQRSLTKNGELLLSALNFFSSSVNTLCNKTIEDTLITIRQYEAARIEYDAYRSDMENSLKLDPMATPQPTANTTTTNPMAEEAQKNYQKHKETYEKFRADVTVKMQFLDENRIKVMHKQLILLHNAVAAYFSGNAQALEGTLKQFSIKETLQVKSPNSGAPSWLEQ